MASGDRELGIAMASRKSVAKKITTMIVDNCIDESTP